MDYLGGIISEIKQSSGIYCFENKINGNMYIGQSKILKRRLRQHVQSSFNQDKKDYDYPLHRAIRKYGLENFNIFILEYCSEEELNQKEIYYMEQYSNKIKYNIVPGGGFCPGKDPEISKKIQEKRKITMIKRYGTDNPLQVPEIKEKWYNTMTERYWSKNPNFEPHKRKLTVQEKYGTEFATQSEQVKAKIRETNLRKYGVPVATQSPEIQEKIRKTILERYGVEHISQVEEVKEKKKQTSLKSGRFNCYRNIQTGFVFSAGEASDWLDRKDFAKHISRALQQQQKRFGIIPQDLRIDRKLWGKKAYWEKVSYEEYLARPNQ